MRNNNKTVRVLKSFFLGIVTVGLILLGICFYVLIVIALGRSLSIPVELAGLLMFPIILAVLISIEFYKKMSNDKGDFKQ